jgi:hypothetical protein
MRAAIAAGRGRLFGRDYHDYQSCSWVIKHLSQTLEVNTWRGG